MREKFERSFSPEPNTGCWLWTGTVDKDGYGILREGRRYRVRAHRFAWQLERGPVAGDALVLHRCDTPPCVNPSHLFIGTQADNVRDARGKGRLSSQTHPERYAGVITKIAAERSARPRHPPRPCVHCDVPAGVLRRGMCPACNEFRRRNGHLPPPELLARRARVRPLTPETT